jgi:hypothetical protein
MRAAALSVDLDSLDCYHRLHGLAPPRGGADPVYGKAAERFGDLCGRLGIRGTVFAIGERLADPAAAAAVRRLAGAGHEVANHTFSHDYALTRRDPSEIASEVRRGAAAVEAATGRAPVGFRAPGYTLTGLLLRELSAQGYRYDSSALPAAPYWLAKAATVALLALSGRRSAALVDRPRVLFAPRGPYHPSGREPYARGELSLLELPVTTGPFGVPLLGTVLAALPFRVARALLAGAGSLPLVNLELHGVDFLDASDASTELARRQRDLCIPAAVKLGRLEALLKQLGREWLTLEGAAVRLAP